MLVKVKADDSKWLVYDNVETLSYSSEFINGSDFVEQWKKNNGGMKTDSKELVLANRASENDDRFKFLSFNKGDKEYYILFNTVLYLCGDTGKTMEKVSAGERR